MPERERSNSGKLPQSGKFATAVTSSAQMLRDRAQGLAQANAVEQREELDRLSPEGVRRLLHELRVHQIELELQNEELRRAQEELEVSRARYFELYDLAPVGYLMLGKTGLVLEANLTAAGLLGVARRELVKQPWTRFVFPEDQDVYFLHRKRVMSTDTPQTCNIRLLRENGVFWSRIEARVAYGADGEPFSRVTFSDIDVHERTKQALRISETRHRILFESSQDALMTLAPPEWQFTSGNAAARALFGAANEAAFTTRTLASYSPERQPDARFSEEKLAAMIAVAMLKGAHDFKWSFSQAPGTEFNATVSLVRMEASGAAFLQATVRNETEAQRHEAMLAQTERLAGMGVLAASVGHEINNPLAYVQSNLETLTKILPNLVGGADRCRTALQQALQTENLESVLGEDAALLRAGTLKEVAERASEALDGARRIRRISKVLNGFSRIDTLELSRVDVVQVLESAIGMALNELRFRATLVREFKPLPRVRAAEGKLAQVFLNLLINASHAMDAATSEDARITIRTWAEAGSAFVEIEDTGEGISEKNLERIFEPFFSTKPIGSGSGLGLSICRRIVAEFGGSIDVRSELGKGTHFVVRLPALADSGQTMLVEPAAAPKSVSSPVSSLRARILIVDDEAPLCMIMKRLLPEHEVVVASSGKDAQALLERDENFDLVICDLMMPGMTGMDLHKWLLSRNPVLAEHLLFVTGGVFGPVAQEYLAESGVMKIDKPFDNDTFVNVVCERIRIIKSEPPPSPMPTR
jgi:PAS domain S-box-containing protein